MTNGELVKLKFNYDPETGLFERLFSNASNRVGPFLGSADKKGYLRTSFNGKVVSLHRLAWLYMTGDWPTGIIDHRDGVVTNNKWDNLRDTTLSTNSRNRKKNRNNKSGVTGVSYHEEKNKWRAYVCVDGEMVALGSFEYKEDAILARMTAEKKYGYWVDKVREED